MNYLDQTGLTYFWSKIKQHVSSNINTVSNYTVNGYAISTNPVLNKADVGLGSLTNDAQVKRTEMGQPNGVATLDNNGLVPASQLPSYVDDVLEYANLTAFPETGEDGKIYVAEDTNLTYRWTGTQYIEISKSLALGETSSTAYAGDKGKANREAIESLPDYIINSVGGLSTTATNATLAVTRVTKSGLNYGSPANVNVVFNAASSSAAGLMSAADKAKLDGVASGAQVNDHLVIQNAVTSTNSTYNLLYAFGGNNTSSETNSVTKANGLTYNPSSKLLTVSGTVNAVTIVKNGGAANQALMADGSVSTPISNDTIDSICV